MINTLLEIPSEDEIISCQVTELIGRLENAFLMLLIKARDRGDLNSSRSNESIAKALVSGICGLRVYNKTNPSYEEFRDLVDGLWICLD